MQNSQTIAPSRLSNVPRQVYLVLLVGLVAASMAAIFIRFAQAEGVPSLAIAAGRLTIAVLVLTPFVLARHWSAIRALSRRDLLLIFVSGFFLAIHFAAWVTSLEFSSVMISVVLVSSGPIWVALLEVMFLKTRLGWLIVAGIAIAVLGGIIIGFPSGDQSLSLDNASVTGGLLALLGAMTVSVYVVIGRNVRARLASLPYIWLVYGVAALLLLLVLFVTRTPITGYSTEGYLWVVIMALVPQLIGHSSFNYALGYLPATFVSVAAQVEPIGSAVAAYFLFNEVPTSIQFAGSLVLVVGVLVVIWGQARTSSSAAKA
jgi:drug/metabolite transporter (DMT)-like permease